MKSSKQTAQFTGLVAYLKGYVRKHYPKLEPKHVFLDPRGAFAYCSFVVAGVEHQIRLRVPLNAPVGARPLFDSLYSGDELVWRYSVNYQPNVPWGEQRRIHLYEFGGVYLQVHVKAGTPYDIVEQVILLNGTGLTLGIATMIRVHVAKLWGMTTTLSKQERKEHNRLLREGTLKKPST